MSREYDIRQVSEGEYTYDLWFPINRKPSISGDGSRVVFSSKIEPGRPGYSIRLYEDGDDAPRVLSVEVDGSDRVLASSFPQISEIGGKIIFDTLFDYVGDLQSGIYVYDIDSGDIRRVVTDNIPRYDSGVERIGEPGMTKHASKWPSISGDGSWITYVWEDYEYTPAWGTHWRKTGSRLIIADISGERPRGSDIVEIASENTFGHGFYPPRISGDGRTIAFYAGGVLEGLDVMNVDMPPYNVVRHSEYSSPTCDVYCYVIGINGPGDYRLLAVPDPDSPTQPLVVAHPYSENVQSFNVSNLLCNPPSLTSRGDRIALNAGLIMGHENTGIYVYEPIDRATRKIITFGESPGSYDGALRTGSAPSISSDGHYLAYYLREVTFPLGYGDPSSYEEGETYCPCVHKDEVIVHRIPFGDTSKLIETESDPVNPCYTSRPTLDVDADATHVAFVSRADKTGGNSDNSHEIFYATMTSES